MSEVSSVGGLESRILMLRGHRVLLDSDLAELYGVSTRRLNEQVKRNMERFPEDFMFQLTLREKSEVIANCDDLKNLRFSATLPMAFTEHGALMAAGVLNSPTAIRASVEIIRAFVRLRAFLSTHQELAQKLGELELKYDEQFHELFEAVWMLMETHENKRTRVMGFTKDD